MVEFNFEDAGKISGTSNSTGYASPDVSPAASVIPFSAFSLTDDGEYGRITSTINGGGLGSTKAGVTARGTSGNSMHFSLDVPSTHFVDLTSVSFDYGYYSVSTGTVSWELSVVANGVSTSVATGGFTHDGTPNYQEPARAAAVNIDLSAFTDLVNTEVEILIVFNSSRSNTFDNQSHTLDNFRLEYETELSNYPVVNTFSFPDTKTYPNTDTLLSWDVSGADTVSISGLGTVSSTGSTNMQITEETTYTITATNQYGTINTHVVLGIKKPNVIVMLVDDWGSRTSPCPSLTQSMPMMGCRSSRTLTSFTTPRT